MRDGPLGDGSSGAGARSGLLGLRLHPATRAAVDPELARAQMLEREDSLRALHALRVPLGLDVEVDLQGSIDVRLVIPRSLRRSLLSIWTPRLAPWTWSEDPGDRWSTDFAEEDATSAVGVICGQGGALQRAPLRSSRSEGALSPWTLIVPALRTTGGPTRLRWIARPVGPSAPTPTPPSKRLPRSDRDTPLSLPSAHRLERELEDLRGERGAGPFWECGGIYTAGPRRAGAAAGPDGRDTIGAVWDALSGLPGGGRLRFRWARTDRSRRRLLVKADRLEPPRGLLHPLGIGEGPVVLTPAELLLWLPPWDARRTPGMRRVGWRSSSCVPLGSDDSGEPVVWSLAPAEGHHMTVTGETGMGKSTLLQHLAAALANRGHALVVIDPLGETAQGLLPLLAKTVRERAVWVSPLRSPVGINALELPLGLTSLDARAERERRVSELVTALRRVRAERYGETVYWGPRIEDLLTRTLLVLSYSPGSTLHDAAQLLSDPDSWGGPLPSTTEEGREVQPLWESLRREGPEERQGALRVVQEVALSSAISRVLAARSPRWSLARALGPGAVTFFDLERTMIGVRASSYLGAALLSLLWSHLVVRKDGTKVVLLLDEVQEFANDALSEMLRLGRRYNLHVLAATQSLSALSDSLRDSLVTNSRDLLLFRGSAGDARLVREGLGVGREHDLTSLPRGTALALFEKGAGLTLLHADPPSRGPKGSPTAREALLECIERSRPFWSVEDGPQNPTSSPEAAPEVPPRGAGEQGGPTLGTGTTFVRAPEPERTGAPGTAEARGQDPARRGELELPLLALLVAALEAPQGEPFAVTLVQVRRLCGEDERTVRRLGACLKGAAALVRTERRDGERVWWLLREHLEGLVPTPWHPHALSTARELWEKVREK